MHQANALTAKLSWGLLTIYKGAIEPILTYGAPIWEDALKTNKNTRKLQRVQRLFNIKLIKAYRTISYDASCIIAGIPPIDITIATKAKLYRATHGEIAYDAPLAPRYWSHPAERIQIKAAGEYIDYPIQIYTDGSKTGEEVGAAAAIYDRGNLVRKLQFKLGRQCSNNQAESLAILKALQEIQTIKDITHENREVAIYTDSQISLSLLYNNYRHYAIIENILKTVGSLEKDQWKIKFSWVKAHIGIRGNELADKLAKEAAKMDQNPVYEEIPKSRILSEVKEIGLQEWQNRWNSSTKGTITKSFLPQIKERLNIKLPITPEFTAILSGHGKTNHYFHRFHITADPNCTCSMEPQTVNHLIYECRILRRQRAKLIEDIRSKGEPWPATNQQLINKHLKIFNKFILSIRL